MIETTTGNMNPECEQIQTNFNVVVDDDVIKEAFEKIKNKQVKELKSWEIDVI